MLLWRKGDAELHRRQLEVTFPPRPLLEQIWREGPDARGVPRSVLGSAERLRFELRPDRGPVDWSPIERRRKEAEARIAAIEGYARGDTCRRRQLLGYFGEKLRQCAGCDRCATLAVGRREAPEVRARLVRLRSCLGGRRGPWGGALLEPEVMLRLARDPPDSVGALADVAGVGPALAASFGATVMQALGRAAQPRESGPESAPLLSALRDWRSRRSDQMGVAPFLLLADSTLQILARVRPGDRSSLARVPGVGPRTLAKFGDELVQLIGGSADDSPSVAPAHAAGESAVTDHRTGQQLG